VGTRRQATVGAKKKGPFTYGGQKSTWKYRSLNRATNRETSKREKGRSRSSKKGEFRSGDVVPLRSGFAR